jgi:hypothetical protein
MKNTNLPLLALMVLVLPSAYGQKDKRNNILFLFSDDWGRYASCYKGLDGRPTLNDVVQTPNVDRVAKDGVLFRNAFVNAPSCTPCRSSLFSGRYFFNCNQGAILNGAVWDESIPVYPLMLKVTRSGVPEHRLMHPLVVRNMPSKRQVEHRITFRRRSPL